MRELSRDEIFAADDLVSEVVPVPEWGPDAAVRVRAFSVEQRDGFFAPLAGVDGDERTAKARELTEQRLLAFAVVNAQGEPLFTEADIPRLAKKSPAAIDRVAAVARRLNGLGVAETEQAEKNS